MSVSPITATTNTYSPAALEHAEKKPETHPVAEAPETDSIVTHKKLSAEELSSIHEQQTLSFKQMLYGMLNTQAGYAVSASELPLNAELFSTLNITPADSAKAAEAISKDGEWGVDAVATRIMDMAVALSGGDTSKIALLRDAVSKGFEAAGVQWGTSLPSITKDTHEEINNRFDYWEKNGSLDGYGKEESEEN